MNIKWFKIYTDMHVVKEALRILRGYDGSDAGLKIRSLIDYELSNMNYCYIMHPKIEEGFENGNNPIREAYIEQLGKKPKINYDFGSCVVTLPRMVGRNSEDFPDISEMNVEEARKVISKFYSENEEVKEWLEESVEAFIEVMKIRREDILYAALHFDEHTPHVHIAFLMTYVMLDENKEPRKDENGNEVRGCDRSRVTQGFLKTFHKRMVDEMTRREMPYADRLINGKGNCFDPDKMNKTQREKAARAEVADEILQAKIDKGLITREEADGHFYYKKNRLKNKDDILKEKQKELDDASSSLSDLEEKFARLLRYTENLEKEKMMFELEIQDKISEVEDNITYLVDRKIKEFQVELIGLSENEVSERITVLCSELFDEVKREVEPIAERLKEVREELSFEMDNDMEL